MGAEGRTLMLVAGVGLLGWAWWQRYQGQSGTGTTPTGPIPTAEDISGVLTWGEPQVNGVGIRSGNQPANVTIDIQGMRAGDPYIIQNRRLSDGVTVSQSKAIVPSSGRVLLENIQTPVPWWEPGDYEVVLIYFDIVKNLQPGFRIVAPAGGIGGEDPLYGNHHPLENGEPWGGNGELPDRDPWNPYDDPFRWNPWGPFDR